MARLRVTGDVGQLVAVANPDAAGKELDVRPNLIAVARRPADREVHAADLRRAEASRGQLDCR